MAAPSHLIVVESLIEPGEGGVDPEKWYAEHADQVSRIDGVVRVERYWSEGESEGGGEGAGGVEDEPRGGGRHLALYYVTDGPGVMATRFAEAKELGRLSSSPFPNRVMRSYRLQSVLAE